MVIHQTVQNHWRPAIDFLVSKCQCLWTMNGTSWATMPEQQWNKNKDVLWDLKKKTACVWCGWELGCLSSEMRYLFHFHDKWWLSEVWFSSLTGAGSNNRASSLPSKWHWLHVTRERPVAAGQETDKARPCRKIRASVLSQQNSWRITFPHSIFFLSLITFHLCYSSLTKNAFLFSCSHLSCQVG